jgi:hypothetical protein
MEILRVRAGELADPGSWVYLWLRSGERRRPVVHVGATGLPPVVRTWLHLHDADPDVGRLVARYPDLATDDLDVLVFAVPDHLSRATVKAALVRHLSGEGLLAENYVGDPPTSDPPTSDPLPSGTVTFAAELFGRILTFARGG